MSDRFKATIIFDIDGVIRDVGNSYRKAIADTVEEFTQGGWRPTMEDLDHLKSEGIWNNDWKASQELVYRYFEAQEKTRAEVNLNYDSIVDYFQERYRGKHPELFDGYIADEPLLASPQYFQQLESDRLAYGFFSGATRGSAEFILKHRLKLDKSILVAMEDAPSKPNPQGMFDALAKLESANIPTLYVGDTVADMYTVIQAREQKSDLSWIAVGVLPPPHTNFERQTRRLCSKTIRSGGRNCSE